MTDAAVLPRGLRVAEAWLDQIRATGTEPDLEFIRGMLDRPDMPPQVRAEAERVGAAETFARLAAASASGGRG